MSGIALRLTVFVDESPLLLAAAAIVAVVIVYGMRSMTSRLFIATQPLFHHGESRAVCRPIPMPCICSDAMHLSTAFYRLDQAIEPNRFGIITCCYPIAKPMLLNRQPKKTDEPTAIIPRLLTPRNLELHHSRVGPIIP